MQRLPFVSMTLSLVAGLSTLSGAALSSSRAPSVTPGAVARMIERFGGRVTVDRLIARKTSDKRNDLGLFDEVLDGISSGDPAWLALVPRLDTGGHAAAGESMPIVVAYALPKNAAGVLRLVSSEPRWLVSCAYPVIEPTRKEERSYFRAAIPAVKAVRDPRLQRAKRLCLSRLLKAERTP